MMNNIFNQFDPSSNTINHSMLIMITMFLILSKPTNKNSIPMIISLSTSSMKKEIQTNMSPNNKKMSTNLLSNSLIQISLMNLSILSTLHLNNYPTMILCSFKATLSELL